MACLLINNPLSPYTLYAFTFLQLTAIYYSLIPMLKDPTPSCLSKFHLLRSILNTNSSVVTTFLFTPVVLNPDCMLELPGELLKKYQCTALASAAQLVGVTSYNQRGAGLIPG